METIKCLIAQGADLNLKPSNKISALSKAVSKDNLDIVKLLVENGAIINTHEKNGETPFHRAILNNHKEIIKFLIEKGADLFCRTVILKNNSIEVAMKEKQNSILKMLLHHQLQYSYFYYS